ncbi:dTDP-glucose pyrophosphorylase [Lachnospiraceae bacterium RM5]|nr:dTDP-glucose pyrophosphorylase [Lachnospiraceae bacterium RM5]
MKQIHLVMPMAGEGTRFLKGGIHVPKPMIELQGKPFFYWAVQSLNKYIDVRDTTFIVLQEHVKKYKIDECIKSFYPEAIIIVIPKVLNGAVLTCCEGIKGIKDESPIIFNDCDHAFISESFYKYIKKAEFDSLDGAMLTFKSNCPNYSYIVFDKEGNIIATVEKVVMSNEAICGTYYFKNKKIFEEAVKKYLINCQYHEFFISGVYDGMIKRHAKLCTFTLDEHISYGTPEEYNKAKYDERLKQLFL